MPAYVMKEIITRPQGRRLCVVLAGNESRAARKAKRVHGGNWKTLKRHETLDKLKTQAEDSPNNTVLLNI